MDFFQAKNRDRVVSFAFM